MFGRFLERVKFWLLTIGLLIVVLLPFDRFGWLVLGMLFLWLRHVKRLEMKGSPDETQPETGSGTAAFLSYEPGQHASSQPGQEQAAMESKGMEQPDLERGEMER